MSKNSFTDAELIARRSSIYENNPELQPLMLAAPSAVLVDLLIAKEREVRKLAVEFLQYRATYKHLASIHNGCAAQLKAIDDMCRARSTCPAASGNTQNQVTFVLQQLETKIKNLQESLKPNTTTKPTQKSP